MGEEGFWMVGGSVGGEEGFWMVGGSVGGVKEYRTPLCLNRWIRGGVMMGEYE